MWYLWSMIKALIDDIKPWLYAVLIVVVMLLVLSTAEIF
jgi:hypothetical protein